MVRAYNHICIAKKCYNSRINQPDKGFFGFPSDPELCGKWLTQCGRRDLSVENVLKSRGYYKLCADHFEDKFFTDSTRALLNRQTNPVPTHFTNNVCSLLPAGSQVNTCIDVDLQPPEPLDSDGDDVASLVECVLNPYELLVESNRLPISYRTRVVCKRKDYDAETISEALLNLEPHTELYQLEVLCRFCMNKASKEFLDVFAESEESSEIRRICDSILPGKLEICDRLPHKVCRQCVLDLRTCHRLMEQFRHADQYLRAIAKYSLFIDTDDNRQEDKSDTLNIEDFLKPIPKKALVMPLKTFQPVVDGFKGYNVKNDINTSTMTDYEESSLASLVDLSDGCEDNETVNQSISIISSDNDTSVSHLLQSLPLPTSDQDLWLDDDDLMMWDSAVSNSSMDASSEQPFSYEEKCSQSGEVEIINSEKDGKSNTIVSYKCLECLKVFSNYEILCAHVLQSHKKVLTVENLGRYNCSLCAKDFKAYKMLAEHLRTEHEEEKLKCSRCGPDQEGFINKYELNKHIKNNHVLTCPDCEYICYNEERMKSHISAKHETRLECNVCSKQMKSVQARKTHELTHKDRSEVCWICGAVVKNKQILRIHMRCHDEVHEKHSCDQCQKVFRTKYHLRRHKKYHIKRPEVPKNFVCDRCPKRFTTKFFLDKHLYVHTTEKHFKCEFCPARFKHKDGLWMHQKRRKEKNGICPIYRVRTQGQSLKPKTRSKTHKPYKYLGPLELREPTNECSLCGKKFIKLSNLKKHVNLHNYNGDPELVRKLLDEPESYKCEVCGRFYFSKISFQEHMSKHTGEVKPFKCDFCPKRFRSSAQISVHERIHTGEKPFECSHCNKAFITKTKLLDHEEALHTEGRKHICLICNMAFKTRSRLHDHTFRHEDASLLRPFPCPHCGNQFITEKSLKIHISRIHEVFENDPEEFDNHDGKGYPCPECGKFLASREQCKKHMRRMHRMFRKQKPNTSVDLKKKESAGRAEEELETNVDAVQYLKVEQNDSFIEGVEIEGVTYIITPVEDTV